MFKRDTASVIGGGFIIQGSAGARVTLGPKAIEASQAFAALTPAQQAEVIKQAAAVGGDTYNFGLSLFSGKPIEASLEIASELLGIIDNVTSRIRR